MKTKVLTFQNVNILFFGMIKNNKDFVMIKILYFHTKLKGNHTLFYYRIFLLPILRDRSTKRRFSPGL